MAEEKQDLRVKKTQRLLASAMLALLEKSSFGKITVNDICTEAMVSRSAFYSHFEDKYALLNFCLLLLQQRMFEKSQGMNVRDHIRSVLENISINVKIFRNLLMADLDKEIIEMIRRAFHEELKHVLDELELEEDMLPGPSELISVYYASGITSVIMFWISQNMSYSIDEVADCLCALLPGQVLGKCAEPGRSCVEGE